MEWSGRVRRRGTVRVRREAVVGVSSRRRDLRERASGASRRRRREGKHPVLLLVLLLVLRCKRMRGSRSRVESTLVAAARAFEHRVAVCTRSTVCSFGERRRRPTRVARVARLDEVEYFGFGQTSRVRDGTKVHARRIRRSRGLSIGLLLRLRRACGTARTSDGTRDLLDRRVVLALDHSPDRVKRYAEGARQLANVFDLLVSLTASPRESDSTLTVDREIVHLGDREFGVLAFDELDESATFSSRDLAVRDFSKVLEEALCAQQVTRQSRSPKLCQDGNVP